MPEDEDEWWEESFQTDAQQPSVDDLADDVCDGSEEDYMRLTTAELHKRLDALIAQEESK